MGGTLANVINVPSERLVLALRFFTPGVPRERKPYVCSFYPQDVPLEHESLKSTMFMVN